MLMIILFNFGDSIDSVIASLQISAKKLLQWFSDNQMKGNSGKCHFITSTSETLNFSW